MYTTVARVPRYYGHRGIVQLSVYVLTLSRRSYSRVQHRDVFTAAQTYLRFLRFVFCFCTALERALARFVYILHPTVSRKSLDFSILDAMSVV